MVELDPTKTTVPFGNTRITLAQLAEARDFVRQSHMVLDPFPMVDVEVNDSKAGKGQFTIRGHAAVFNRLSLDLGGFREKIDPNFFDGVLDEDPDVHALWDHDTRWTLARTRNKTLELRVDPVGLHNWMRVAPTSFANDLRILMERGDIDQESFAFTVALDRWEQGEDGAITRTLMQADALYDVTITAKGAYPQTGAEVVRSMRSVLDADRTVFPVSSNTFTNTTATGNTLVTVTDVTTERAEPEPDIDAAPDEEAVEQRAAETDEESAAGSDEASHAEEVDADPEADRAVRELKAKAEQRAVELERLKERLDTVS